MNDLTSAQLTFMKKKAEIDKMLADLQALSADNFKVPQDEVGWGYVGLIENYADLLCEIKDMAFGE